MENKRNHQLIINLWNIWRLSNLNLIKIMFPILLKEEEIFSSFQTNIL